MKRFLERFALLVAGVLHGFDRLVFKGRLCPLYTPEGMNCLLCANHVPYKDFKDYAYAVTAQVLKASLVSQASALGRYRYLNSSKLNKEEAARQIAIDKHVKTGLVCVLSCVEPCWTFDKATTPDGLLTIRGEPGKCNHLYHYFLHPQFGWMYVRLQTWFPFEIQVGLNGREWLARQMNQEKLRYVRSDNKFLWIRDWQRAQELLDEQPQTDWLQELDALQQQVHPLHPGHLGKWPLKYNWTTFQSEWATDVAFRRQEDLHPWFDRWLRQALLTYDHTDVLRFFGRSPSLYRKGRTQIQTSVHAQFEGKRIKHWVGINSLKQYTHANVLRTETTINDAAQIFVRRPPVDDPQGTVASRRMRRSVVDLPRQATFSQQVNDRYLEALAATAETRTVQELLEPLTQRVPQASSKPGKRIRYVRGLNPLAKQDADVLLAVHDPKWMINGLRNRDLVAALYNTPTEDAQERRRRSSQVTRLLRLLRAHGLLEKIPHTQRYHVPPQARTQIQALLASRNANPDELITKAA
jgi:hypothetical protein